MPNISASAFVSGNNAQNDLLAGLKEGDQLPGRVSGNQSVQSMTSEVKKGRSEHTTDKERTR